MNTQPILSSHRDGDEHMLVLSGELDISSVAVVEREIKRVEASDAATIVIDLRAVTLIGVVGIRTILEASLRCRGGRLVLLQGPPAVQRPFDLCGLTGVLPFVDEA